MRREEWSGWGMDRVDGEYGGRSVVLVGRVMEVAMIVASRMVWTILQLLEMAR